MFFDLSSLLQIFLKMFNSLIFVKIYNNYIICLMLLILLVKYCFKVKLKVNIVKLLVCAKLTSRK